MPVINVIRSSGNGCMRSRCVGKRAAEQRRRAREGLPPLPPPKSNQEVPSIPFPLVSIGKAGNIKATFEFGPYGSTYHRGNSRYVRRFRMEVMRQRPEV